jgi:peptide deformylase
MPQDWDFGGRSDWVFREFIGYGLRFFNPSGYCVLAEVATATCGRLMSFLSCPDFVVMSQLKIVSYPHPALRWKSRDVTCIDAQLQDWVRQMFELMYEARGIGLAANQVALPYRLFVINPTGDPEEGEAEQVFINPQIVKRNGSEEDQEGCLSLPEIFGRVTRAERITVEAFDLSGEEFRYELSGLTARVVQHEYDHLDGVMFTDRVAADVRKELDPLINDLVVRMAHQQKEGLMPSSEEILSDLRRLEAERTEA